MSNRNLSEEELAALGASAFGRMGGKAGRGDCKRRDPKVYLKNFKNRWTKHRAEKARKGKSDGDEN